MSRPYHLKTVFLKFYLIHSWIFCPIYQYDMISLSESYLDLSVSFNNDNLHINGYKLVRAKHRANLKRGGVCVLSNPYLWDVCLTLA